MIVSGARGGRSGGLALYALGRAGWSGAHWQTRI